MADRTVGQGDTLPPLDVTLEIDDCPVNLVGCAVTVTMQPLAGGADVITAAACSVDADQQTNPGHVVYQWQPADTAAAGYFAAQWQVTDAAGQVWPFPSDGRYTVQIVPVLA